MPKMPHNAASLQHFWLYAAKSGTWQGGEGPAICAAMYMPTKRIPAKEIPVSLFGLNMARARELADLSQTALDDRLGVSRGQVNRWENSPREPRFPMRKRIAVELGQPLTFFYDEGVLGAETSA